MAVYASAPLRNDLQCPFCDNGHHLIDKGRLSTLGLSDKRSDCHIYDLVRDNHRLSALLAEFAPLRWSTPAPPSIKVVNKLLARVAFLAAVRQLFVALVAVALSQTVHLVLARCALELARAHLHNDAAARRKAEGKENVTLTLFTRHTSNSSETKLKTTENE